MNKCCCMKGRIEVQIHKSLCYPYKISVATRSNSYVINIYTTFPPCLGAKLERALSFQFQPGKKTVC